MKKIIIIAVLLILLPFISIAQDGLLPDDIPILTQQNIADILNIAIADIERQGCKPEFLNYDPALIWCRCKTKDGKQIVKVYVLKPLIKAYLEAKKAKEKP